MMHLDRLTSSNETCTRYLTQRVEPFTVYFTYDQGAVGVKTTVLYVEGLISETQCALSNRYVRKVKQRPSSLRAEAGVETDNESE
jgi:hypothetical protein